MYSLSVQPCLQLKLRGFFFFLKEEWQKDIKENSIASQVLLLFLLLNKSWVASGIKGLVFDQVIRLSSFFFYCVACSLIQTCYVTLGDAGHTAFLMRTLAFHFSRCDWLQVEKQQVCGVLSETSCHGLQIFIRRMEVHGHKERLHGEYGTLVRP